MKAIAFSSVIRTPADVGAAIRARRRAMGLDQAELARRVGASCLWVDQIERGKAGASLALVLRAFAALDAALLVQDVASAGRSEPTMPPDINAIIDDLRKRPEA